MIEVIWDYFHLSAKWVHAVSGTDAIHDVTSYMARERQDLEAYERGRQILGVTSYMDRSEVVAERHFFAASTLNRDEIWAAVDQKSRRRDGEYAMRAGKSPRLASFVDVRFPDPLSEEQKRAIATQFAETLVRKFGCAVETALHVDLERGTLCHMHLLMTDRVVDHNGVGIKIREFNSIAAKHEGKAIIDGGRSLAPHCEFMRSYFTDLCAANGVLIDHRSFKRQGRPYDAVAWVPDAVVHMQERDGIDAEWRVRRTEALAERRAEFGEVGHRRADHEQLGQAIFALQAPRSGRLKQAPFNVMEKVWLLRVGLPLRRNSVFSKHARNQLIGMARALVIEPTQAPISTTASASPPMKGFQNGLSLEEISNRASNSLKISADFFGRQVDQRIERDRAITQKAVLSSTPDANLNVKRSPISGHDPTSSAIVEASRNSVTRHSFLAPNAQTVSLKLGLPHPDNNRLKNENWLTTETSIASSLTVKSTVITDDFSASLDVAVRYAFSLEARGRLTSHRLDKIAEVAQSDTATVKRSMKPWRLRLKKEDMARFTEELNRELNDKKFLRLLSVVLNTEAEIKEEKEQEKKQKELNQRNTAATSMQIMRPVNDLPASIVSERGSKLSTDEKLTTESDVAIRYALSLRVRERLSRARLHEIAVAVRTDTTDLEKGIEVVSLNIEHIDQFKAQLKSDLKKYPKLNALATDFERAIKEETVKEKAADELNRQKRIYKIGMCYRLAKLLDDDDEMKLAELAGVERDQFRREMNTTYKAFRGRGRLNLQKIANELVEATSNSDKQALAILHARLKAEGKTLPPYDFGPSGRQM